MDDIAPKLQPIEVILQMPEPSWFTEYGPLLTLISSAAVTFVAIWSVRTARKAIKSNETEASLNRSHQLKIIKEQMTHSENLQISILNKQHESAMNLAKADNARKLDFEYKKLRLEKIEPLLDILNSSIYWPVIFLKCKYSYESADDRIMPMELNKATAIIQILFPNLLDQISNVKLSAKRISEHVEDAFSYLYSEFDNLKTRSTNLNLNNADDLKNLTIEGIFELFDLYEGTGKGQTLITQYETNCKKMIDSVIKLSKELAPEKND